DEHGLDLVLLIRREALRTEVERKAFAPFGVDRVDGERMPPAQVAPEMRELAEDRDQHAIAGRQRVGDRRLPTAGARGRKQEDLAFLGFEDVLQIAKQRQRE